MLDKTNSNRLERRSVIIPKDLKKYNIDIAAPSEVRLAKIAALEKSGVTPSAGVGKLHHTHVNLVCLLLSGMVYSQVCLNITNL